MNKGVSCHGCKNFYITYKQYRPYGCKAYGFISKILPSKVVFNSSGIECAYKNDITGYNRI
ncbi:MAG: hypothetical protein CMJ06_05980 [Pelagibacterales bacterium]|nr:hypothetical protein [Pelagibacterales bacterium]OUU61183.1 MAG: hypothetical protein CBC22_08125 [Alphaproteobacteria bacterium TMED62]|tara:strand:+ start:801 stop:983 length:183 start_codon:yes stop_codon:yes gene_type:complete